MLPLMKKPKDAPRALSVLVADDVHEIKQLVSTWLEEEGHRVLHASGGREVIRIACDTTIDLVITDIVMPDGDGWDAILAVNRLRPATRVLAISGGGKHMPADACLRVAKGVGADGVLKKPFGRAQLLAAVTQIVSGNR
jgi:CheY-like chemotaxis protein